MAKKLTHNEFLNRLYSIRSDIKVLTTYISNKDSIRVEHTTCGRVWDTTPNQLLKGRGCSKCSKKYQPTHTEFVIAAKLQSPDMTVLGRYKNNKTKILVKHDLCEREWLVSPSTLLNGKAGCGKCSGMLKKTATEFIQELAKSNSEVVAIDPYINAKTKILFRHNCGYEWLATPNNILRGSGCPSCKRGKSEKELAERLLLKLNDILILFNDRYILQSENHRFLELDIFIPLLRIAIEYHGIQHYEYNKFFHRNGPSDLLLQQKRDEETRRLCKKSGIMLLEVSYLDFNDRMSIKKKEEYIDSLISKIKEYSKISA